MGHENPFESRVLMHGHTGIPTYLHPKQFNTALETALANQGIVHIAAGGQHCLALTRSAPVLSWGVGRYGQCGHGNQLDCPLPLPIRALENERVVFLAAGDYTSACVTLKSCVFIWGYVHNVILGSLPPKISKEPPMNNHVIDQYDRPITKDRTLQLTPIELTAFTGKLIRTVALGAFHLVALTQTGKVYTIGLNNYGQCGIGEESAPHVVKPSLAKFSRNVRVVSVAAGRHHTLALDSLGTVWSWGRGRWGALGHGSEEDMWKPYPVAALSGHIVVNIGCGDVHSCAVLEDGTLCTWGKGSHNRLGLGVGKDGCYSNEWVPRTVRCILPHQAMTVKAGHWHTTVLTHSKHLMSFGSNYRDQSAAESISKDIVSIYQLWPRRGELAESDCPAPLDWVPITVACGQELTIYIVAPDNAVPRLAPIKQPHQQLFLSHYWRNDIIPHWGERGMAKIVWKMCADGVPDDVRGIVWRLAVGNSAHVTEEIFKTLSGMAREQVAQAREMELKKRLADKVTREAGKGVAVRDGRERECDGWVPQVVKDLKLIQLDLPRTNVKGLLDNVSINELRVVLVTFALNTPNLGYVQGMSLLVSNLLTKMNAYDAFVCLSNLVCRPVISSFYHMDPEELYVDYAIHQALFHKYAPRFQAHLEAVLVIPQMYLVEWFLTLFTNTLPLTTVCRVWDRILIRGDYYMFVVSTAILQLLEPHLITAPLEEIVAGLKQPFSIGGGEQLLLDLCDNIRLTPDHFEEMKVNLVDHEKSFSVASI